MVKEIAEFLVVKGHPSKLRQKMLRNTQVNQRFNGRIFSGIFINLNYVVWSPNPLMAFHLCGEGLYTRFITQFACCISMTPVLEDLRTKWLIPFRISMFRPNILHNSNTLVWEQLRWSWNKLIDFSTRPVAHFTNRIIWFNFNPNRDK